MGFKPLQKSPINFAMHFIGMLLLGLLVACSGGTGGPDGVMPPMDLGGALDEQMGSQAAPTLSEGTLHTGVDPEACEKKGNCEKGAEKESPEDTGFKPSVAGPQQPDSASELVKHHSADDDSEDDFIPAPKK